jgi:ribosomal protein L3 glutamine methyltransferase
MSRTVAQAVRDAGRRLVAAGVAFGHGTTDATQEALWLAAHVQGKSWAELTAHLDAPITAAREKLLRALVERRITTRKPAAYLLNEAWLGPHKFYVDERVIVPRSFIAELLRHSREDGNPDKAAALGLDSRLRGNDVQILDLCTGSGCLAILAALAYPGAKVDAADISAEALEVAKRNVADYKLARRVRLVRSDLFKALAGRKYDLIVSNPPYVKAASMKTLPEEYRQEPRLALASGKDGLEHTRAILARAREHLNPGGLLVVEIGHNRRALELAYPKLAFEWPRTSGGRRFVFTLSFASLSSARIDAEFTR